MQQVRQQTLPALSMALWPALACGTQAILAGGDACATWDGDVYVMANAKLIRGLVFRSESA
jgi:hypothetical protein